MKQIVINGKTNLCLNQCRQILKQHLVCNLDDKIKIDVAAATNVIKNILTCNKTVYGINTGFGKLAKVKISHNELTTLQHNIILSHAAGVGNFLEDDVVRLIMLLKIHSLARGYSGVRFELITALAQLYNTKLYPCIPEKGSVGASGDLAPLAHLAAPLIGAGFIKKEGTVFPAVDALKQANILPLTLAPKEGLALLNGTQVSNALALKGLFLIENCFYSALIASALSIVGIAGDETVFDPRIHHIRGQQGQIKVADTLYHLLNEQQKNPKAKCRVQDPYSIRCQPQVMGACLDFMIFCADILLKEANAVTDNPLIFSADQTILSGGNFHAEPVAMAADNLAIVVAEIGAISERRIALLIDTQITGLPAFLVPDSGINSGFMLAQVSAAALASENKSLAHPASIDSLPTSANQEDHVSMATYAARRLNTMAENTATIVAIELLAAVQAIDLMKPVKIPGQLEKIYNLIRKHVPFYAKDRYFASDIELMKSFVMKGKLNTFIDENFLDPVE